MSLDTDTRSPTPVLVPAVFTGAYLLASAVAAVRRGSTEFLLYIGVMLVLVGVVWLVHRRVNLVSATLWCLSAWGLLHMLGGLVTVPSTWPTNGESGVLYTLWLIPGRLKYDHVVHAFGFGATTWVCWQGLAAIIQSSGRRVAPTLGLMTISIAAGLGFGALNEVVEFFVTLTVPESNVGGYINTGWDLVANLVGTSLAASLIVLFHHRSPTR
jgi:uncharacterized membrane protein YjdF